jgi:hypothetical protein
VKRNGDIRRQSSLTRKFLDVCEPCNQRLNQKFETLRPAVEQFYDGDQVGNVESLCRWLVKTAVLYNHPQLMVPSPSGTRTKANRRTREIDEGLIGWIMDEETSPIPPWLSIWVARFPRLSDTECKPSLEESIDLYEFKQEQRFYKPSVNRLYVAGKTDLILVDVVYHPGCVVGHPFDGLSTAAKILPSPQEFDLTSLEHLSEQGFADWNAVWGWPCPVGLREGFNPLENPWPVTNTTEWRDLAGTNGYGASATESL